MATLEALFAQSVSREALAQKAEARKRRFWHRLRLLPVVILSAGLLLGVKVTNIALAADGALDAANKKDGATTAAPAKPSAPAPAAGAQKAAPAAAAAPAADSGANSDFMSRSEINLLQDLSSRRQQLEGRSIELDTRERLLMATEQRIDKKIERLKKIEAEIKDLLRLHDDQQEAQIQSLVRVYEAMKPKEAALIFEKLEMDILVSVIEKMKDKKIAPIMAAMKPDVAKALTVQLATRKKLPQIEG
ncbi:MotE family protein [Govanella unica]|uniref:Magnesium transporter MgtE intracellular domain-containing protein n=1 Tax=Govanella unica TaxID=2975056 RepID=A0A9X3TXL7_9PROT|nr:hypothetical protein [Govania unica]MDA5193222.1 hypothetical protein [Govania unica]